MNIRGQGHRRNIGHLARGIWRAGNGASCLRERRPSDREVPGNPELLRKGNVTLPPPPPQSWLGMLESQRKGDVGLSCFMALLSLAGSSWAQAEDQNSTLDRV